MAPPFDQSAYDAANAAAHAFYGNVKHIQSPLLGPVLFNSEGFMHLLFKDEVRKERRDIQNQLVRFRLLPLVPHVLSRLTHCQEYFEVLQRVDVKMNKERFHTMKLVRYWGFVAVVKNYKLRIQVVVRQVGEGSPHFWSVIPYWSTKHYKDVKKTALSKGDLVHD